MRLAESVKGNLFLLHNEISSTSVTTSGTLISILLFCVLSMLTLSLGEYLWGSPRGYSSLRYTSTQNTILRKRKDTSLTFFKGKVTFPRGSRPASPLVSYLDGHMPFPKSAFSRGWKYCCRCSLSWNGVSHSLWGWTLWDSGSRKTVEKDIIYSLLSPWFSQWALVDTRLQEQPLVVYKRELSLLPGLQGRAVGRASPSPLPA